MSEINSFEGRFCFLSNFHPSPFVGSDGNTWDTVEHFFQAMKTLDVDEREFVRGKMTAGRAKRAGRKVTLRKDWDDVKLSVMEEALIKKFTQNKNLGRLLVDQTGDNFLCEGNTWHDQFWGNCTCPLHKDLAGENHLGRLLMEIREILVELGE